VRILERNRRLGTKRTEELEVGRGVEKAGSLRPGEQDAGQLPAHGERNGNLRTERRQRFVSGVFGT
jgi:hypothetical protein